LNTEIIASLDDEINKRHAIVLGTKDALLDVLLKGVNAVREAGVFLKQRKEKTPRGEWANLFRGSKGKGVSSYTFAFSYETAQIYIRMAETCPEPILALPKDATSVKQVMIALGVITPSDGHGEQVRHAVIPHITLVGKAIAAFDGIWDRWVKKQPLEQWSPDQKEKTRKLLEPVVRLYDQLA